ncbi:NIL domain-containing protein [Tolypothrix sp. FACHB-123]|uniref:NIL domain-containing protein n=1 Tax=Tolypothrix sp. FACHB-123 TaxID=2692868 RepID=UPI001682C7C4|nr:NIL domain-containing protein [Tolypothrix sp. FACHB-123]MBD2359052.1 NIL domain-containing protein [Tolypothrix sp. FACHB-123]
MTAFNQVQFKTTNKFSGTNSAIASIRDKNQLTQIRLCVHIPKSYLHEPVISRLISEHGLIVNITSAMLGANTGEAGRFDLEIRGSIAQISTGLAYLESLNLKIVGKPNVNGDSWSY